MYKVFNIQIEMSNKIQLDQKSRTPLYLRIKSQIQEMILNDILYEGISLPPTRKLARILKVNRNTVVAAYNELAAEGIIDSHVGRGSIVKGKFFISKKSEISQPLDWSELTVFPKETLIDSFFKDLIDVCSIENIIFFASGIPAPECLPVEEFQEIITALLRKEGRVIFQRQPTRGHYPLREMLAHWMNLEGRSTSPKEVLITSGSQQAIYLISKTLLDPGGDVIVVESPTYLGVLQVFKSVGAKIFSIPVDENGMRVDILENFLSRQRPKFIYTLPIFQNPSGTVLSLERRNKLIYLAYKFQVPIIEDDAYSNLYYERTPPPSLNVLDKNNYVIYISTFSKMLFPGLRIGWIVTSQRILERLRQMKQLVNLHSNSLGQWAVHEFCRKGFLEKHLKRVQRLYLQRRNTTISALKRCCSSFMDWNKPDGGFYLWCKLKKGLNSIELLREVSYERVAFIPGETSYTEGKGAEWLRLNFTYEKEESIKEGIKRLSKVLRRIIKRAKKEIENDDSFELDYLILFQLALDKQ